MPGFPSADPHVILLVDVFQKLHIKALVPVFRVPKVAQILWRERGTTGIPSPSPSRQPGAQHPQPALGHHGSGHLPPPPGPAPSRPRQAYVTGGAELPLPVLDLRGEFLQQGLLDAPDGRGLAAGLQRQLRRRTQEGWAGQPPSLHPAPNSWPSDLPQNPLLREKASWSKEKSTNIHPGCWGSVD